SSVLIDSRNLLTRVFQIRVLFLLQLRNNPVRLPILRARLRVFAGCEGLTATLKDGAEFLVLLGIKSLLFGGTLGTGGRWRSHKTDQSRRRDEIKMISSPQITLLSI